MSETSAEFGDSVKVGVDFDKVKSYGHATQKPLNYLCVTYFRHSATSQAVAAEPPSAAKGSAATGPGTVAAGATKEGELTW